MDILLLVLCFLTIVLVFSDLFIENHLSSTKSNIPKIICPCFIRISVFLFIALIFSLIINVISFISITNMTKELSNASKKITEMENNIEYSKQLIEYSKNN